MSLTVEKLNDDATFIFAFAPPFAPQTNNRKFPGAFTILIDPWLQGSSSYLHPSFQEAQHTGRCTINSLSDLQEPPDLIIISQEKPDHCHQETLCSLPKNTTTTILATPPAAKKIRSWDYFDEDTVQVLRPYNPKDDDSVFRTSLPSYTSSSSEGEITVANVVTKYDVTGLHNAIGITYRSPGSILSALKRESINLTELLNHQSPRPSTARTQPKLRQSKSASRLTFSRSKDASLRAPSTPKGRPRTASSPRKPTFDTESIDKTYTSPSRPPAIPPGLGTRSRTDSHTSTTTTTTTTTTTQSPLNTTAHREKPLTVLYTPHGISLSSLQPYLTHYLEPQQASSNSNSSPPLPSNLKNPPPSTPSFRLTALFHCLSTETNPIFLGGTVAHGAPGGIKLAKALHARNWFGTHDEVKVLKGWSTMWIRTLSITFRLPMDSGSGNTPGSRPSVLGAGRQDSNQSYGRESQTDGAGSGHITIPEPQRPSLPKRNTLRGESTKSISEALRLARTREEQETLLGDEELADDDGCYPPRQSDAPRVPNPHRTLPIYTTIHKIRRLIYASIDDPYSNEQLRSPRMNAAVIRPLVDHIYDPDDVSIIYCLLVNRIQFLREQSYQAHHQTVNITRANVCELIASRVLRRFDEDHEGREGLLKVANVLVAGFEPFQGAPRQVLQDTRNPLHWSVRWKLARPEYNNMLTALEVAIVSEAKSFLASSACQRIVDNVYRGRIIYTPTSFIDILPDHYKNRGISLYDPRKAPLLNQYRLIVPRTRNWIEVGQFMLLLLLYILTMINKADTIGPSHLAFSIYELAFVTYAFGWTLDEIASILEHGWTVHTENLWSFLDIAFVTIFSAYFSVRMHGLMVNDGEWSKLSLDLLSVAMPVMLPRLAFCLMPENMLFISLRAMMADFTFLTILAAWCFGGFLIAMRWLSEGADGLVHGHHPMTIAKWMLWIWFGLDGTGVQRSVDFHWFLGPALMITFAFLGNTLFLTILVAMLSSTYQNLAQNATAEIQFRRAVLTFEGVKSDSLFAYRPPFNVLAL
ncbi:receptor-activated Ca2+-permeable cation channel, partial [Hortaea werneckii]